MSTPQFNSLAWKLTFNPIVYHGFYEAKDRWMTRYCRWFLQSIGAYEDMPAKGNRNGRAFEPVEFVTINLDGEMEKKFRLFSKERMEHLTTDVANFVAEEHKIGISWDGQNACFIASATCKDEKSENNNCCITARSDDWAEALLLLLFKATVVAGGKPWSAVSRPSAWG